MAPVSNDQFLAACIKHAKEKVVVDFDSLSVELGMSAGGARNKYRDLVKKMAEEGAMWAKPQAPGEATASPKKARTPKKGTKRKTADEGADADAGGEGKEDGEGESKPIAKKARAKKVGGKGVTDGASKTAEKVSTENEEAKVKVEEDDAASA